MPRPLRIEFHGAWYHVMNRGANHQNCFILDELRKIFLALLAEISEKFNIEIHSYCLMDNHYHLLIRTPYPNLSKAMRHLNGVYTQRFNLNMNRDGPLFRGRYKSILIEEEIYLLQVSRYIHLNPVLAQICSSPCNFEWSSFRYFKNPLLKNPWLHTKFLLNLKAGNASRNNYAKFVEEGIDNATKIFFEKIQLPSILGSKQFIHEQLFSINEIKKKCSLTDYNRTKQLPCMELISKTISEHYQVSVESLLSGKQGVKNIPRMIAIYLSNQLGQQSYHQISKFFTINSPRSLSPILTRCRKLIRNYKHIENEILLLSNSILEKCLLIDVGT